MGIAEQWNWVGLAYAATYISLVVFAASIASRINKARQILEADQ